MPPEVISTWAELPLVAGLVAMLASFVSPRGRRAWSTIRKAASLVEYELTENAGSSTKDMVQQVASQTTANHDILEGLQSTVGRIEDSVGRAHGRIDSLHERVDRLTERD